MFNPLKITVMLGGPSAEREVSLRTGSAVAKALRELGHVVHELDPIDDQWLLPPGTDVVFLALHGNYGEDGTVQRRLENLGIPYTGCDSRVSAVAFDKMATKRKCLEAGVPTPRFHIFPPGVDAWPDGWKFPVVIKPVLQGSSVGLSFVENISELRPSLARSRLFGAETLMEEKIIGRETTVAILAGEVLPVVEVRPKNGPYDYKNKYTAGATDYLCPAPFEAAVIARIQDSALRAFEAIGGGDYARVDVMVNAGGQPFVLEVNTLPGMTETSLFPKAAQAANITYSELCQRMIELALGRITCLQD